jgi:SET domain-containing protein
MIPTLNEGSAMIAIGPTAGRGRGVFARRNIRQGETLEETPVVVIPAPQLRNILKTPLRDYYFRWGAKRDQGALALGLCSLCNHAPNANTDFVLEPEYLTIRFFALSRIRPGEEVTVNYNGIASNLPVWFEVVE